MEYEQSLSALRKIPLFSECNEEDLKKIAQILIPRSFEEKEIVFMQGDLQEYMYFILRGKVKIYRTDEQGREQIFNILESGDFFPHVGFFQKAYYPAHSVMMEKGELLALPTARLRHFLFSCPEICMRLMAVMESKIIELQARLEELVLHDTFGRVILLLLRLSRTHGVPEGSRLRINFPLTNQELANMIGTTRETVSRTLSQLKKTGAIETTTNHYFIIDRDLLEKQL